MNYKNLVSLFFLVCSCVGLSYGEIEGVSKSCLQNLIPCLNYLKETAGSPPNTCCVALKEAAAGDSKCFCQLYNQPDILKKFGTNIDNALALAQECGANSDTSVCNAGETAETAASPPLQENALSADNPANSSVPTNPTQSDNSKTESGASGAICFGGSYIVTLCVALIVSAVHMQ